MIEAEVGPHDFDATEWPVVRRIIHAAGDLDLVNAVSFTKQAAHGSDSYLPLDSSVQLSVLAMYTSP